MFGFIIGTICLVLLIGVLRHGRWHRGYYGHGCGHHGGYRGHWGPRAFLYGLLRRIDATPAQEKVFRDELSGIIDAARGFRDTFRASRGDLAGVLRDEAIDKQKLDGFFRKQDELLASVRQRLTDSLGRVHQTLDAEQRQELANLVERGARSYC